MKLRLRIGIQMMALVAGGGGLTACGELLTSSRLTTSDPFAGKSWSETAYLEPDSENPSDAADPAVRGFEGQQAPGQDDFWLAASFYNRISGQFEGYARRYQPGAGWAEVGDDFRVVASEDSFSAGAAQISVDASGGVLAAFVEDDSLAASTRVNSAYRSTSWKELGVQTFDGAIALPGLADDAGLVDSDFGVGAGWPMDLLLSSERPGIGFFFGAQNGANPVLSGAHWSAGSGFDSGLVQTSRNITQDMTNDASPVLIREDAGGGFCVFTEGPDVTDSSISVIHAQCSNAESLLIGSFDDASSLGDSFTPAASSDVDASISGTALSSGLVDAAFDGDQTLMSVFYRYDEDGVAQLYSRARVSGAWEDYLEQITGPVTAAYSTAFDSSFHVRPAVVALSIERFLVVWPGYDFSGNSSSLFFSIHDLDTGWSRPRSVGLDIQWAAGGVVDDAGPTSVIDGLWLFGNEDGEAALAVRYLGDETSDTIAVDEVPRKWAFLRYSDDSAVWDATAIRSRPGYEGAENGLVGCVPFELGALFCSQPPSGAVFSDGSAVMVFPTEDNEKRARLGTVIYQ